MRAPTNPLSDVVTLAVSRVTETREANLQRVKAAVEAEGKHAVPAITAAHEKLADAIRAFVRAWPDGPDGPRMAQKAPGWCELAIPYFGVATLSLLHEGRELHVRVDRGNGISIPQRPQLRFSESLESQTIDQALARIVHAWLAE